MRNDIILQKINENDIVSGVFYCQHLLDTSDIESTLGSFKVKIDTGYDLEQYLKNNAIYDEVNKCARTYLVKDCKTDEIVGYFSLRTGMVSMNERRINLTINFDTYPAIELSNFAINDNYKEKHSSVKHLGEIIFKNFVFPLIQELSEYTGINLIMIYALPYSHLISFYETLGFLRLPKKSERRMHRRMKPSYDRGCIFMFQKI